MQRRHVFASVLFAVVGASCGAILGIDDLSGDGLDAGVGGAGGATSSTSSASSSGNASSSTSTSSSTSSASSSTGGPCTPGTTVPCYDGPIGTQDVGICTPGTTICASDGMPGKCMGDVVPKPEDCSTPEDDDCNGKAGDDAAAGCICVPATMGACMSGQPGACAIGAGTCDATGKAFASCTSPPPGLFDDCVTPADENCDGMTPACTGAPAWASLALGNNGSDDAVFGLAPMADGSVVYGGMLLGTLNAADGYGITAGRSLLGRLSPLGVKQFQRISANFVGASAVRGVATAADGSILAVGSYTTTLNFGAAAVNSLGGSDAFVVRTDPLGNELWLRSFGSAVDELGRGIAVDPVAGRVYVVGSFQGNMIVGGAMLANAGAKDVFVACYNLAGAVLWAKGFGGVSNEQAWSVAATPDGDVVIAGDFSGTLPLGAPALVSAGATDVFVARLSGAAGVPIWAKSFGDAQEQTARAVAVAPNGDVAIAGQFHGTVSFGGASLTAVVGNGNDAFAARFDQNGNHIWSRAFGGPGDQLGAAVTADAGGEVVVTGAFDGSIDLGSGPMPSAGLRDVFIAKLAAKDGATLWKAVYGDVTEQRGWAVTADPQTNVFLGGGFQGTITFGAGISLTSVFGYDRFVAKLSP